MRIIDDHREAVETAVEASMAALRLAIDRQETSIRQQIYAAQTDEIKRLEDYKGGVKRQSDDCDLLRAKLEMLVLMKGDAKLLRSKEEFQDVIKRSNEILQTSQMPGRTSRHLHGFEQLEALKTGIAQCGRYARCDNPELEKRIVDINEKRELNLDGIKISPADMKIVVHVLRCNPVRSHEFDATLGESLLMNQRVPSNHMLPNAVLQKERGTRIEGAF